MVEQRKKASKQSVIIHTRLTDLWNKVAKSKHTRTEWKNYMEIVIWTRQPLPENNVRKHETAECH